MSAGNPFASLPDAPSPAAGQQSGGNPFEQLPNAPQQAESDGPGAAWVKPQLHALGTAAKDVWGMVTSIPDLAKQAVSRATDTPAYMAQVDQQTQQDDKARQRAGYGKTYRTVAPIAQAVGVNVKGMEDDASKGDSAGVMGHALAPALAAGVAHVGGEVLPAVKGVLKNAKENLMVSPELKAAAAKVGDAPVPSASDIHSSAASDVQSKVGPSIDKAAQGAGVDTSGVSSLSEKAEVAGRAYRKQAQATYSQLDDAAQQATGQPGRFQDLTGNIRTLEQEVRDPMLKASEKADVQARLDNATKQYEAFKQEMVKAGIDEKVIKSADKAWAQGAALDEVSRGFLTNEDTAGNVKPSARPLDAPVKKFTAPASPRGHILKQALGDDAAAIQQHVTNAGESVAKQKAAAAATREANKATNAQAASANQRIRTIRRNQTAAAGLVGLGYAASKGKQAIDVLSGH